MSHLSQERVAARLFHSCGHEDVVALHITKTSLGAIMSSRPGRQPCGGWPTLPMSLPRCYLLFRRKSNHIPKDLKLARGGVLRVGHRRFVTISALPHALAPCRPSCLTVFSSSPVNDDVSLNVLFGRVL